MHRSAECCREAMNVPRGQTLHSFVAASRNMPSPQNFSLVTVVVVVVEVVVKVGVKVGVTGWCESWCDGELRYQLCRCCT